MILYLSGRGNGKNVKQLYLNYINQVLKEHPEAESSVKYMFDVLNDIPENCPINEELYEYQVLSVICENLNNLFYRDPRK